MSENEFYKLARYTNVDGIPPMDLSLWKSELERDVAWILEHRCDPPPRRPTAQQWLVSALGFACCAPCGVWSCMFRLVCVPARILVGPHGSPCAGNPCTACTDAAVHAACAAVPPRHPRLLVEWSRCPESRRVIARSLLRALSAYPGPDICVVRLLWKRCASEMDRIGADTTELAAAAVNP